jgi:hypothetical protein
MKTTSKTKDLIAKYGIKMTMREDLTEKAMQIKIANANHPKIVESRRLAEKLNLK